MVSSRTASAPPQKKCKKKGLPHYLMRQPRFLYKENPALDAGFRERYAFDQKSSKS